MLVVNPADAAAAGLADGERGAVVTSAFGGDDEGTVRVDEAIVRGAVGIPHGWVSPNVSDLLSASEGVDPLTGMPTYCCVPITLAPAG